MPTRTISAAGGNWNATTTWVGGVVPIANDDILGLPTSGNLTINVATPNLLSANFEDYLGTLTLNNSLNIGTTVAGTASFSATMSFATSTTFNETNSINPQSSGTLRVKTNGKNLPYFRHTKGGGAGSIQLLDDLNVTTLSIGLGNSNTNILGTFSIFCNHFVRSGAGGGSFGSLQSTTSTLNFVGPTASYTNISTTGDPCVFANINIVVNVGSSGTFSTTGPLGITGNTTTAFKYEWRSGILAGDKSLMLFSANTSAPIRLDFANSGTWSNIYYNDNSPSFVDRQLILLSDLYFDNLISAPTGNYNVTSRRALLVNSGSGALKGGRILASPTVAPETLFLSPLNYGMPVYFSPTLKLNPGPVHTFSDIQLRGSDTGIRFRYAGNPSSLNSIVGNALIVSSTASVQATLNFTGDASKVSQYVQYTDINASGGNMIYNYGGSQSNSLNIGTASFGGGSATTAFTFVN
jgi:hypothetical protein